jgi:hypothetical protein
MKHGSKLAGKDAVMALLQRHGKDAPPQVRLHVLHTLRRSHVQEKVRANVEAAGSTTARTCPTQIASRKWCAGVSDAG